jgi:hypothetical protein
MIEPELSAMAKKIGSGELPLDPNAYALAVYEGYEKLWKRQATEAERERIVALLESLKCACDGECGMVEAPFTVLRELIEGKNE